MGNASSCGGGQGRDLGVELGSRARMELQLWEIEQLYRLPLRNELNHWVLRELRDNVFIDNPSKEFFTTMVTALCDNLDEERLHVIRSNPHLLPPIHLDHFSESIGHSSYNNRMLKPLYQLIQRCVENGIYIHHLKIFEEAKFSFLGFVPHSPEEPRLREILGPLIKTLTLSYKISPDIIGALESMLNDFFPNLKALAFDCTIPLQTQRWRFPRPTTVENASFKTPLKLQKLAFKASSPYNYNKKSELISISKLIAKLIRCSSSINPLIYLSLDLHRYEFYKFIMEEMRTIGWIQISNLKTLVFFLPIIEAEELCFKTTADFNSVTSFLTRVAGSVQNFYLKSPWNLQDADQLTLPNIPKMSEVETLAICSYSPLTTCFKIMKSFPNLKTLILICFTPHGKASDACTCPENEISPTRLLTETNFFFNLPSVTLLAIERFMGSHAIDWLTYVYTTFPNLVSFTFALRIPELQQPLPKKRFQASFLLTICQLLSNLKKLKILRIALLSGEELEFGDERDPHSLYQAFKAFLNIPKLRYLVIDFGPEHRQKVPKGLLTYLFNEMNCNRRRYRGKVEILQTLEFNAIRDFSHIASCRQTCSDLSLGYYESPELYLQRGLFSANPLS